MLALLGCKAAKPAENEVAYVTAVQASLRDRVAAVYNKTGTVNNGERVEVLERSRNGRFARIRTARSEEGWLEQRYLAPTSVYQNFVKLADDNHAAVAQARGLARADLNMHLAPDRDAEHLYQLKEGAHLELLQRATTPKEKPPAQAPATAAISSSKPQARPPAAYEDWWLVRDERHRCGWVLSRMVDVDVPIEVAQYAEGKRIIADFVLNTVPDQGKPVAQHLLLLNEPQDGQPQDFNQLRVFTWNPRRHHYETAYRELNLAGLLPASVGTADFGGKEGRLPVFTIRVRDAQGRLNERKYKLNGVMVRRVLAPGEQPAKSQAKQRRTG